MATRLATGNGDRVATGADIGSRRLSARFALRCGLSQRGRQRKQAAATLAERRGPTLHAYALGWLDRYAGSGRDSVRENTRREYRRLLTAFALRYFDRELLVRDLDRVGCSASSTG